MELGIIAAILLGAIVGIIIGCALSHRSTDFDYDLWQIERNKRQEVEFRAAKLEDELRRAPTIAQLQHEYTRGYSAAWYERFHEPNRLSSVKETRLMYDKLSAALKPLDKLREELKT
jgi:hypothetical protein